jgi:hypothetical protein
MKVMQPPYHPMKASPDTSRKKQIPSSSREAAEVKSASGSRINAAKADLRKSLESAKRKIPAPDKDILSRAWSQIEERHNL